MADPRLILGKIIKVNGTTPGPARGITYDIAVHDPNIEGVFTLLGQRPMKRLPDTIDIDAYIVGDIVIGSMEANKVRWHFQELPAFAECPTVTPPTPTPTPNDPLVQPIISPYPTVQVTTISGTIAGAESTPVPPDGGEA